MEHRGGGGATSRVKTALPQAGGNRNARQGRSGNLCKSQHDHMQREGNESPGPRGSKSCRGGQELQDGWNEATGYLLKMGDVIKGRVMWPELWKAEPQRIKFLIQAVYDMLPNPLSLQCMEQGGDTGTSTIF